jgi:hypothetical protein
MLKRLAAHAVIELRPDDLVATGTVQRKAFVSDPDRIGPSEQVSAVILITQGTCVGPLWLALHKQDGATRLSLMSLTQAAIDRRSEAEVSRWEKQKEKPEGALRRAHT